MPTHTIAISDTYVNPDPGDPSIVPGVFDQPAAQNSYVQNLKSFYKFLLAQGHTVTVTLDAADVTGLFQN